MLTLLGALLEFVTLAFPQLLALMVGIAIKLKLFGPAP